MKRLVKEGDTMQIISVSGFGYSGSGAVIDYLKGYSNISVFDAVEFQLLHEADGLLDLRYFLSESRERISCNAAINRFYDFNRKEFLQEFLKTELEKNTIELLKILYQI